MPLLSSGPIEDPGIRSWRSKSITHSSHSLLVVMADRCNLTNCTSRRDGSAYILKGVALFSDMNIIAAVLPTYIPVFTFTDLIRILTLLFVCDLIGFALFWGYFRYQQ